MGPNPKHQNTVPDEINHANKPVGVPLDIENVFSVSQIDICAKGGLHIAESFPYRFIDDVVPGFEWLFAFLPPWRLPVLAKFLLGDNSHARYPDSVDPKMGSGGLFVKQFYQSCWETQPVPAHEPSFGRS